VFSSGKHIRTLYLFGTTEDVSTDFSPVALTVKVHILIAKALLIFSQVAVDALLAACDAVRITTVAVKPLTL
jgi:hypothetical protein